MEEITKSQFETLTKDHNNLKKSHEQLLEILSRLTEEMRSMVDTMRSQKKFGEETTATRLRVHYDALNDAYLKLSRMKTEI